MKQQKLVNSTQKGENYRCVPLLPEQMSSNSHRTIGMESNIINEKPDLALKIKVHLKQML